MQGLAKPGIYYTEALACSTSDGAISLFRMSCTIKQSPMQIVLQISDPPKVTLRFQVYIEIEHTTRSSLSSPYSKIFKAKSVPCVDVHDVKIGHLRILRSSQDAYGTLLWSSVYTC